MGSTCLGSELGCFGCQPSSTRSVPFGNGEEYERAHRQAALLGYVCGLAGIKGKELADMLTPPSARARR